MHSRAKERAKLLTAIAGVALIVAAVVGIAISLMTGMPSGGGISGQVTIQPYTEDSLADIQVNAWMPFIVNAGHELPPVKGSATIA